MVELTIQFWFQVMFLIFHSRTTEYVEAKYLCILFITFYVGFI